MCSLWSIWKERNKRAFNEVEQSDQAMKSVFMYAFVYWGRVYMEDLMLPMIDFVD